MKKQMIAAMVLAGVLMTGMIPAYGFWGGTPEKFVPREGAIRIPTDGITGQARFFTVTAAGGTAVTLFAVKGRDGVIRTALNACDVCFEAGKGYTQKGDSMVCLNCGRSFPIERIGTVSGGCNPVPLGNRIEKGEVVIQMKDVDGMTRYFKNVQ